MRDVHSHILPGLDNGPRTMSGSLMMLSTAMNLGVTSIVCTPHCHDSRFRFESAWQAFLQLKRRASTIPGAPQLTMGFEVGYHKLKSLGMDAAPNLGNGFGEFLLEMPDGALPIDWEHVVQQLQRKGFKVIIAHPERIREVQSDVQIARRFVNAGCQLQISARNIEGGLFNTESRTAKKLVQAGLVTHIASEAHNPDDYELFVEAWDFYGMQPPENGSGDARSEARQNREGQPLEQARFGRQGQKRPHVHSAVQAQPAPQPRSATPHYRVPVHQPSAQQAQRPHVAGASHPAECSQAVQSAQQLYGAQPAATVQQAQAAPEQAKPRSAAQFDRQASREFSIPMGAPKQPKGQQVARSQTQMTASQPVAQQAAQQQVTMPRSTAQAQPHPGSPQLQSQSVRQPHPAAQQLQLTAQSAVQQSAAQQPQPAARQQHIAQSVAQAQPEARPAAQPAAQLSPQAQFAQSAKTRAQRVVSHLQRATQSEPDPNSRPYVVSTQPSHACADEQGKLPQRMPGVPKHGKHAR